MTARQDLVFDSPWMNAAGFGGFVPGGNWLLDEVLGMFFTNPVSLKPRPFSSGESLLSYPGGFLLHTGHPNPGLEKVLKTHAAAWRQSKTPVCIHLIPEDPFQAAAMTRMIEAADCAAAVEIACPPECTLEEMPAFWQAAAGELPVIAYLPLGMYDADLMAACRQAGVEAVSLGAPRGIVMDENGKPRSGRLYGPALLPQLLAAVTRLKGRDMRIIAGGGIFRESEVEAVLRAGASAVQLDAVLWRPGIT